MTSDLTPYLTPMNLGIVAAVLAVLCILTLVLLIVTLRRLGATRRRYEALTRGPGGQDLDSILLGQATTIDATAQRVESLEKQASELRAQITGCLQHIGVVRFNAFPDVGADLSFAIALLDESSNGVVVTGLYGREDSRVYAKPIAAGASSYLLTGEEKEALKLAVQGPKTRK